MPNDDDWTGIALHQRRFYLISGTQADFILDYGRYDPAFRTHPLAATYRNGVMCVNPDNVSSFLQALNARELTPEQVRDMSERTPDRVDLIAFIDFDANRFVHSYYDLALEDYVPRRWHGALGAPWEDIQHRLQNS